MKKFKKVLVVFLAVCLLMSMMPITASATEAASGTYGDDLTWVLDTEGTLTISGAGAMPDFTWNYGNENAPWYDFKDDIQKIIIGDGIVSIGDSTFDEYSNVTEIEMADSVLTIGYWAFANMRNLGSIRFSQKLETIEEGAFLDCVSLQKIIIPDSVTEIESNAFLRCTKLEFVQLPKSMVRLEGGFGGCTSLESIELPETLTYLGSGVFDGCTSLQEIKLPNGLTYIGGCAFQGCSSLKSVVIPERVENIKEGAFGSCTSLEYVEFLANGSLSIWGAGFSGCTALQSIVIPKSVSYLDFDVFYGCTNLTEVTFCHEPEDELSVYTYEDEATVFGQTPVSTVYVVDKENIHPSIVQIANSSSEPVVFRNIADKYTAGLSAQSEEVRVEDTVEVSITVDHGSDTVFNAGEISLSYDTEKLTFDQQSSSLGTASVKVDGDNLLLEDYGADKNTGSEVYTLVFTAKADGEATVTMTDAAFADSADAVKSDLIPASVSPTSVTITIDKKQFAVTLPDIFEGDDTITDGEDYTFRVADGANYDYDAVTATMNGQPVDVIDNGDGTYTIEDVTGALVITGTRTEKTYQVTFAGNAAEDIVGASDEATYNTAYSFTMPTAEGWAYSLDSIVIGETAYTGYEVLDGVYTIAGTAIKGNIVITVSKVQTTTAVSVEGTGAGAAVGYETTVVIGEDYVLTISPEVGYDYSVVATMDGESVEVIDNGDNTYTVKAVSGALVFTVNRTVVVSGVEVIEYLTINNSKMWLIKNATTVADGKVPTYDGETMFWSDQYGAYCYLVIAPTLSQEEAAAKVGIVEGTAEVVDYGKDGKDVNGTGKVDAADAQLVYDIYNAKYTEFTTDVSMEKFLRADVNGVDGVTVEDAAAIISAVLN